MRLAHDDLNLSYHAMESTLEALFDTQPVAALDAFLLPSPKITPGSFHTSFGRGGTPVDRVSADTLAAWAEQDPVVRYSLISRCVSMFPKDGEGQEKKLCPLFLSLLDLAPNKRTLLGGFWWRIHPRSWTGSLADILDYRKSLVMSLKEYPDEDVRSWVDEVMPELDETIAGERVRDRERELELEESFE